MKVYSIYAINQMNNVRKIFHLMTAQYVRNLKKNFIFGVLVVLQFQAVVNITSGVYYHFRWITMFFFRKWLSM